MSDGDNTPGQIDLSASKAISQRSEELDKAVVSSLLTLHTVAGKLANLTSLAGLRQITDPSTPDYDRVSAEYSALQDEIFEELTKSLELMQKQIKKQVETGAWK